MIEFMGKLDIEGVIMGDEKQLWFPIYEEGNLPWK